ncbi:MAG: WD40 repeat domain-containing serine/threonine protein kinase [Planctomycetota bacterium]
MSEDSQPVLRRVAPDRYSDFELIGKGGMGVVYLALDSELNRRVAFKMVLPDADPGSDVTAPQTPLQAPPPSDTESGSGRSFGELKGRFLQEAWITSGMEHPGIVPVYELGETDEGIPYYTMRYVRGERTMKQAIEAAGDLEERLFLMEPFLKVCDTIRYAHSRGIVHRDLKPENIAIGEFGEVIVLDWGLSKVEGKPDITSARWQERIEVYREATDLKTVAGALGTPGFMAPEAAMGRSEDVDARSDIYSLGAMLFCILTGRLPYEFENFLEYVNKALQEDPPRADEVDPMLPRELADACARALARERDDRFQDVDELAHAVRVWQTEGPIEREIRGLLDQARDEVETSQDLEGNLQLLHLDRATAAINRILHLEAEHAEAAQLQARVKRMRERGIRARVRTDRLAVLQRVAAGLLSIGAIVALVVFGMLEKERERAERDQRRAQEETAAAEVRRDMAEADADRKSAQLAKAYAAIAQSLLDEKRNSAARLVAARALENNPTPTAWQTFARADATWSPTLRVCAYGVRASSLAVAGGRDLQLLIGDDEGRAHSIAVVDGTTAHESWDALNTAVTAVLRFHGEDGPLVAAGGADGRIAILQPGQRDPVLLMPADLKRAPKNVAFEDHTLYHGTAVTALAPGPLPGSLLAGYDDGRLRLFDAAGGVLHVARHHAGAIRSITAHGQVAYTGGDDGSINVWTPDGLILRDVWSADPRRPVAGFRIREDATVDAWSKDCSVWSHARDDDTLVRMRGMPHEAAGAELLDGSRVLAAATKPDGMLRFLELADGRLLGQTGRGGAPVTAVAGARAGTLFAVAREDDTIRVWDIAMRRSERMVGAAHRATGRAAMAHADGTIAVHEIGDPLILAADEASRVAAVAFGPRAEQLASVTLDGSIEIWDILKVERIRRLRDSDRTPFTAVAWGQGDARLYTGDLNGVVRLWPWVTGRPLSLPAVTNAPITVITPESRSFRLAAADADGGVHLWDTDSKTKIASWRNVGKVIALALSPSSEQIVAALEDGTLLRCGGGGWKAIGSLPIGARPVEFRIEPPDRIEWVDQKGLTGTFDHYDEGDPLPVTTFGTPWVRIAPGERFQLLGEAFGLELHDYRVSPVPPAKLGGAINLAR